MESVGIDSAFWRGKTVLVTGHTGFKGSWLCLLLQQMDAKVVGYALSPPTQPSLFEIANVSDGMVSHIGDVRDGDKLKQVFSKHQPEIVLHLAAQALVRHSYVDPVETYSTNVMGTVNLLEALRQTESVRSVVNVTTDKCYENREWVWGYRENEAMGGHDPYSNSKGCSELVTAAYRNSFFHRPGSPAVASARAGNVIGGGDWARDRLIPDMVRAISEGMPVKIRSPHAIRPWQHVMEPLSGYLVLAERLHQDGTDFAEGWNFGPKDDDTRTVSWIVEQLTREWGDGASWSLDQGEHPHEAHYLKLDCSKAAMRLGWWPRWQLQSAIRHIAAWHKAHLAGENMREITLSQIDNYLNS
jgi:CDP-glucose 4,6-dehydratase